MSEKSKIKWINGNTADDFKKILQDTTSPKHIATLKLNETGTHVDFEISRDLGRREDEINCRYVLTNPDASQETALVRIGTAQNVLKDGQKHFIDEVNRTLSRVMNYEGYDAEVDTSDMLMWNEPKHNVKYADYDVQNRHKIHLATLTAHGNGYTAGVAVQEENFRDNKDRFVTYDMDLTVSGNDAVRYTGRIGPSKEVLNQGTDHFIDVVNEKLTEALSWEGIIITPTMPDETKFQYLPQKKNSRESSLEAQIHLTENNETEPEKD